MHDDDTPLWPDTVTDGEDKVWTLREKNGVKGYAIASETSDVDPFGNPWITTAETVRELPPHRPKKVENAGKAGGRLTPKTPGRR